MAELQKVISSKSVQVNWVEFKKIVKSELPESSLVRTLILAEPDELPEDQALVKAKVYRKLWRKELGL